MAYHSDMQYAVSGQVALSAEYNKVIDSVKDLNSRLGPVTSADNADERLDVLESRTTNGTSGNTQLSSRVSTVESRTTNSSTGNTQLGSRLTTVENNQGVRGSYGSLYTEVSDLDTRVASLESGSSGGARPGGEWSIGSNQNLSSNTILKFPTTHRAGIDITHNSSSGLFTVQREGWWTFVLNIRFSGTNGDKYAFLGPSATSFFAKNSNSGGGWNVACTGLKYFTVGETFYAWGYNSANGNVTKENSSDHLTGISCVWLGP